MEAQMIAKKVNIAAKWSLLTQIGTKLITPITNMILARLLAPEAFGVVATINMVISFVDMFTDAGFQKYLVQNEFSSDKEKYESTNVAFITNLSISIIIWGVIIICRDNIAVMLGNPGLGNVLAIACIQLPMTSFSSIQMALYRRNFDFKSLFNINMVRALIPLIVSVPLAKLGFSYWSIIIGSTLGILYNAIVLTIKSDWKPSLFFDFNILKKMFGFSFWSLLEAISIWLTSWIDALIIGSILTPYYLGLYKTSLSLVNSVIMIISGSICPVLFSALSRIQNDDEKSKSIFYKIQKIVAYFAFPIGVGMFIYSDFITITMLGEQWIEASKVVGIWSLTSAFRLVLTSIYSEVYRAKGKPKISLFAQIIHLVVLIPACFWGIKFGFWGLVYFRALIRIESIVTGLLLMHYVMKFNALDIIKNICKPLIFTTLMSIIAFSLNSISSTFIWNIISILICIIAYIMLMLIWAKDDLLSIISTVKK